MAMALHEPVSVVVPLRLCSTPESMDEKSSESDVSRSNSPRNREELSSTQYYAPVTANESSQRDKYPQVNHPSKLLPLEPPKTTGNNVKASVPTTTQKSTPTSHTNSQPAQKYVQTPLPPVSSHALPVTHTRTSTILPPLSSSSSSSSSAAAVSMPTSQQPQLSVTTRQVKGSSTPCESSPVTSVATGAGSNSSSNNSHSLQPPMLLSQNDAAKGNESMLTLSSYVQFMTLQQQGQMNYQTLLPSAYLPQSVANPPTTLPPQYDNFSNSYSPSLPNGLQSFGCANKFNGLIPQQLNQGLIALDMPMAAAPQSKHGLHGGINLGLDQHRFMVGGPLSGALPGYEVARAVGSVGVPLIVAGRSDGGIGAAMGGATENNIYKKTRKRSHSQTSNEMQDGSDLHGYNRRSVFPSEDHCGGQISDTHSSIGNAPSSAGGSGASPQLLKWQAHQVDTWHDLCDGALQDIPQISFTVEADKGFIFSVADDTFVCQKKNHFQVTVHIVFQRTPKFIKIKDGSIQPIDKFILQLHGIKLESVGTTIRLEQSMTDRRRSEFTPIEVQVPPNPDEPAKHTICRLHFGETTANNMRKRGKPNPDQKYFSLVVGLIAVCELGSFPVVAHVSERIIVRASNPGNFDNDCDYLWVKSSSPDSIYHQGRVGINTDKPEEALSVNGNIRVTGRIEHPSDMRIKKDICPVDNGRQLQNVSQLKLYQYQYRDGVMTGAASSEKSRQQVGVLAQELRQIIPDAVHETTTDIALADGSTVSKLLVIDKDRVLMETIGAVQQLKRISENLSQRLNAAEKDRTVQEECTQKSTVMSPTGALARKILLLLLLCLLIMLILHFSTTGWTANSLTSYYDRTCAFFTPRVR